MVCVKFVKYNVTDNTEKNRDSWTTRLARSHSLANNNMYIHHTSDKVLGYAVTFFAGVVQHSYCGSKWYITNTHLSATRPLQYAKLMCPANHHQHYLRVDPSKYCFHNHSIFGLTYPATFRCLALKLYIRKSETVQTWQ